MRYVHEPVSVSVFIERGCNILLLLLVIVIVVVVVPAVAMLVVVATIVRFARAKPVVGPLELTELRARVLVITDVTNSVDSNENKPKIPLTDVVMFIVVVINVTSLGRLGILVDRSVVNDIISRFPNI